MFNFCLVPQYFIRAMIILTGLFFSTITYAQTSHGEGRRENTQRENIRPEMHHGNVGHVEVHRGSVYHSDAHHGQVPRYNTHRFYDSHYGHNHYYPIRGYRVTALPPRHEIIIHRGLRFYFSTGVWYVPDGPRFIVTVPPVGLTLRILPSVYTTVWVGRVPYYYANNVYYVQTPQGYMVTEAPPADAVTATAPVTNTDSTIVADASGSLFAYPKQGQSKKQEDRDRYECHSWGVSQTGFDPSAGISGSSDKSADYKRAMSACLEGRGYTVR